ncbi:unnamed protein product [Caenorhabditis nigoni]
MVKRIFVQGLSSDTTEVIVRKYFEQFGKLYECVVPTPPRYSIVDSGPDDEDIETRSAIRYEPVQNSETLDDELHVEQYNFEKHGSFESYMKRVGEGEGFIEEKRRTCAGYAYVTFLDMDGYSKCMKSDIHEINRVKCTIELAKDEQDERVKVESKRLFVSFFPLERLTSKELKTFFGSHGKITDVEFVSDSEGPLHFCIITFADHSTVDLILKKSIYIRDVLMFTRRAVLKESIKMAEHKLKEQARQHRIHLPTNHTAYPTPSRPVTFLPSTSAPDYWNDPSAGAGYAPLHPQPPEADPSSQYGYGPRKW